MKKKLIAFMVVSFLVVAVFGLSSNVWAENNRSGGINFVNNEAQTGASINPADKYSPVIYLADNDEMGACNCYVRLTGQHWCTETTSTWCNTYDAALSCSFTSGGSCD